MVEHLKIDVMTNRDILLLFNMKNTAASRATIYRMLMTIGNYYPLYEPIPAQYKILTDEDLEEYEQLYRTQKQVRENERKWRVQK